MRRMPPSLRRGGALHAQDVHHEHERLVLQGVALAGAVTELRRDHHDDLRADRLAFQRLLEAGDDAGGQAIHERCLPGIGPAKKAALLKRFGSVNRLARAAVDEIQAVPGIDRVMADAILRAVKTTSMLDKSPKQA